MILSELYKSHIRDGNNDINLEEIELVILKLIVKALTKNKNCIFT